VDMHLPYLRPALDRARPLPSDVVQNFKHDADAGRFRLAAHVMITGACREGASRC